MADLNPKQRCFFEISKDYITDDKSEPKTT